jgi:hypothetical protein
MNGKLKSLVTQGKGDTVNLEVDSAVDVDSEVMARAIAELNLGHRVTISPRQLRTDKELDAIRDEHSSSKRKRNAKRFDISFVDIATTLGGAASLGVTSLAVAPTAVVVASIAAIVGAVLAGIAVKTWDQPED